MLEGWYISDRLLTLSKWEWRGASQAVGEQSLLHASRLLLLDECICKVCGETLANTAFTSNESTVKCHGSF
jgi:hypothetical protein